MSGPLAAALEREHQEIDAGLEAFAAGLAAGETRAEPLMQAMDALRRHIYLEEELLFPSLRAAGMVAPVFVMVREHGEIWRAMDQLEYGLGQGDADASAAVCRELVARLGAHNMKEEQILYPRTDSVMEAPASQELAAFLESGRMPEGWTCAGARG